MSEKEKAVEKACDEERYLELHTDIAQQEVYEEEEMKRMYEAMGEEYTAVGFNYNQSQTSQPPPIQPQAPEPGEDEDEPYETIPDLQVPMGVNLPVSMKIHAIIEKTAAFVAKQGPQMEIVIATKQTNNPQFKFLHYSNELNVYYKHVVRMIKKGKYTPRPQEEYAKKKKRRSSEGPEGGHGYLHPSLGGVTEAEEVPQQTSENFLKSVTAKLPTGQIANTAYAKLLNNLKKHRADSPGPSIASAPRKTGEVDIQRKQHAKSSITHAPSALAVKGNESKSGQLDKRQPPVPGMDPVTLPGPNQPPPPGTVPPEPPLNQQATSQDPQYATQDATYHSPYDQSAFNMGTDGFYAGYNAPTLTQGYTYTNGQSQIYHGPKEPPDGVYGSSGPPHTLFESAGPSQAVYGPQGPPPEHVHGSQNAPRNEETRASKDGNLNAEVLEPVPELKPIIDKMAQYVVRNGPEFEMMMRNKKDERFSFLETWHEYYPYYQLQVEKAKEQDSQTKNDIMEGSESVGENQGSQKGVSFSIKTKDAENAQIAPKRRALLGDSDEEDESTSSQDSEKMADESSKKSLGSNTATSQGSEGTTSSSANTSTDAEKKQAEENLKNRLALAARGKLVQAKEDEKVKAERKKKAAMFAALLKTNNVSANTGTSSDTSNSKPTIPSIHSAPNLSHLCENSAGNSREASPLPISVTSQGNSLVGSPPRSHSRSRTRSPSTVMSKSSTKHSRSRSRTPTKRSRLKISRSRSRSRSKSRKLFKYRLSRSRSTSPKGPAGLPSAYSLIRRSSPKLSTKRRKSRSRSPSSRHKHSRKSRSKSPKHSRSRRSRSRSRSKKHKRSRSRESKHKSKSKSKKRSKSQERKRSKKSPKKSKPKMIPIPELTPPQKLISSDSDLEKETITIESSPTMIVYDEISQDGTTSNRVSDVDSKANDVDVRPSENLLSKVRAMLKAQREQLLKEDGMLSD